MQCYRIQEAKIGFFSELVRGIKIREFRENQPQKEEMFYLNEIRKTMQQRLQPVLLLVLVCVFSDAYISPDPHHQVLILPNSKMISQV